MRRGVFILGIVLCCIGCTEQLFFTSFESTSDGNWGKEEVFEFAFSDPDTTQAHNLYINIRNDNEYPFSNLFIIAEMRFPDGNTVRDTLEYEMADEQGRWLGTGLGSLRENKLWYKENVVFPASGVYTVSLSQAMRRNGSVKGIEELPGILDVGLEIEKKQ